MKNVFIIDHHASSKINGIGTYIKELIFCLKESEMNVCLIACSHDTKTFKIEIVDEVKQMQFPAGISLFDSHCKILDKFLRLYIEDTSENIFVFNHTPCESLIKTVKTSFPLSKFVFAIHDMTWTEAMLGDRIELKKHAVTEKQELFEKEYPELYTRFSEEKRMYEAVDKIITLAPETIELLQIAYGINDEKIAFISNGLRDTSLVVSENKKKQLKAKLFIPPHEKVIVFAARVKHVKGIYQIINSLKKVIKTYPDFRLVVIGTVFEVKKILEYAGEIVSKITFTGQIPRDRLHEWYQIADIGVLASYWEQCSYTGIEMMMHGLPVIASDGFCVGDMFQDGINAKVARIGDRNDSEKFEHNLSEAFLELLSSKILYKKLGENGRKIYESKYQIKYMKEGYRLFFNSL